MSKPFSKMQADSKLLAKTIETNASRAVVEIAVEADRLIIDDNPILTGISSGNWRLSIRSPALGIIRRFFPSGSLSEASSFLSGKKTPRVPVFLSNSVKHIRLIANGMTPNSPPAFWIPRRAERAISNVLNKTKITKRNTNG